MQKDRDQEKGNEMSQRKGRKAPSKAVKFSWAWGNKPDKADPLMTRERAAKLLRAWRKDGKLTVVCERKGRIHAYTVYSFCGMQTTALMVINHGE